MSYESAPPHVKLRTVAAYLGMSERALGVYLGLGRNPLRSILRGESLPSRETKDQILVLSRRAPFGDIARDSWPAPAVKPLEDGQVRRRPTKDGRKKS